MIKVSLNMGEYTFILLELEIFEFYRLRFDYNSEVKPARLVDDTEK